MTRRTLLSILAVAFVLGAALYRLAPELRNHSASKVSASAGTQPESSTAKPIRIAFNTWIGYSSFYIAQKEGIFEKYHLQVVTSIIDPLAEKNAGILRGDLDGMGGTIDSAVISAANGIKASIIMMFDRSNGTDGILVTKNIKSINDLQGKSIAAEEGFVGHFFLLYILDKAGIGPGSIKLIPMTTDDAGTAFAAGRVDAAVTWEPLLTTARTRPGSHVLVSSAELEPILADTLFLSEEFLNTRQEDAINLVRALMEANAMWKKEQSKYLPFVSEQWTLKPDDIEDTMRTVELYDCGDQIRLFGTSGTGKLSEFVAKANSLWSKSAVIKAPIDTSYLVRAEFVRAACHQ